MRKLCIIIPAYNEERRIGNTLKEYGKFFKNLKKNKKLDFEILVVINNTTDNTEKIVLEHKKKCREIRILNFKRGGKGFAVREGFKDSLERENNLIGFVDSDMSTRPEDFYDLVKKIENYGGAIASRYIKGAKVFPKQGFKRIFFSRVYNLFIRGLLWLHYKDTQCGAKLFTRKAIKKILQDLKFSRWAFDIDILYAMKKNKLKVKEIPTIWSDKDYSVINFGKAGPRMVFAMIRLRLLNSFFRDFTRIYDKLIVKIFDKMFGQDSK